LERSLIHTSGGTQGVADAGIGTASNPTNQPDTAVTGNRFALTVAGTSVTITGGSANIGGGTNGSGNASQPSKSAKPGKTTCEKGCEKLGEIAGQTAGGATAGWAAAVLSGNFEGGLAAAVAGVGVGLISGSLGAMGVPDPVNAVISTALGTPINMATSQLMTGGISGSETAAGALGTLAGGIFPGAQGVGVASGIGAMGSAATQASLTSALEAAILVQALRVVGGSMGMGMSAYQMTKVAVTKGCEAMVCGK